MLPARMWSGNGRKTKLLRRDETTKPIRVRALARNLPRKAWKNIRWREGTKGDLASRFATLRVRLLARRAVAAGMAADRMAGGQRRTGKVLAFDDAG